MANEITSTTTVLDQEKFLGSRLIQRSLLRLVCASVCDKVDMTKGTGLTANFIRYSRMNVPLTTLTEGTQPANSTFSLTTVTVTLDQWGDVITLTDVTQLTTKHPVLQEAINLLADNAARVIDREIQIVWLAGTNIQFGDGSVTTRRTITAAMKASDATLHKARVTLIDNGAPPRGGPSGGFMVDGKAGNITQGLAYVGIAGPQVIADIMSLGTANGSWVTVAQYSNAKALYNAEVGTWLGIRWVETNFIPKFTMLGNTTAAVVSGNAFGTNTPVVTAVDGGGSLKSATTFFYKVTRKDLLRGFEEDISIAHSTASAAAGDNESFTFNFSGLTAGFVYNLYFDTVAGGGTGTDATLRLTNSNIAVGTTITVTANPSSGANPPDNVNTTGTPTIHPIYLHGNESCNWVALADLQTFITKDESIIGNVLKQQRAVGYKFLAKAMIRDQLRMIRIEVPSTF